MSFHGSRLPHAFMNASLTANLPASDSAHLLLPAAYAASRPVNTLARNASPYTSLSRSILATSTMSMPSMETPVFRTMLKRPEEISMDYAGIVESRAGAYYCT